MNGNSNHQSLLINFFENMKIMKVSSAQSVTSAVNSSDLVVLCEFATASLQKDLEGSGTTRPPMLWPQNGGIPYSKHVKSV